LRTPLTIVQGYLELLREVEGLDPELRRSFLSKACCACDELELLLANMMDASRLAFDRMDLHGSHLPLKVVCMALVALFEPLIMLEHRHVVVEIADHVKVWADEMRLKQILRNLLANALRYSPPQTPIWMTAALEQDNRMVRLSVIDRGQGIPVDKQQVIFDKFVRLERDLHSTVRGSGLGLYISRQLVEAMGGSITVTSSGVTGEGSCFSFLLPTSEES
jgi:signal transduction histidine kinase